MKVDLDLQIGFERRNLTSKCKQVLTLPQVRRVEPAITAKFINKYLDLQ